MSSDAQETREIVGRDIATHTLEHKSRKTRPVTVRFRTASVGAMTLHEMAYSMFGGGEATIHAPRMENTFLCEINLAGDMRVGGRKATTPFRSGEIYMINANAPHTKIWQSDGRQLMIKVHQRDMEAALERLTGVPLHEPLRFVPNPWPISDTAETLGRLIELLGDDLEKPGSIFGRADGASADRIILDLMLKMLPNNYSTLLQNPTPAVRPRHVRHAAEYIHTHWASPIRLDDLVTASGVSKRSLHSGFRRHFGVPPMTYLRNVRLDRARLRLSNALAAEASVTAIALECGFGHLGKFAAAYRERFGEQPSETLANA